ncbi:MAG TPA: hypothetical protein VF469_05440 [Kofleriaceae bacterium]
MSYLRSAALLALIAASACDKPNDLPRMQDELLASVNGYHARFDELKRRADAIEPRTHALPQDTAAASALHTLGVARTAIDRSLGQLSQVPQMLPAWLAARDARSQLAAWLSDKRRELEAAVLETTSELEAVESWTAVAEQRAGAPQPAAAPPPEPEPTPETDDHAPEPDGSGAPVR